MNVTTRNMVIGMRTEEETPTTRIAMSAITPRIITSEGMIEGTRNGEPTKTKTNETRNAKGTAITDAIRTVGAIFAEMSIVNMPRNTVGSWI